MSHAHLCNLLRILIILLGHSIAWGDSAPSLEKEPSQQVEPEIKKEYTRYNEVTPRSHSLGETMIYVGSFYILSGVGYYLTNQDEIHYNGNIKLYVQNLGTVTNFDNDRPSANWMTHVYFGNLAYLSFRARSYTKADAFLLTALQSALFEFTVENIQEPASLEDLINTPLFGAILGQSLEWASLPLLNSDLWILRTLGHILNPPTIFWGFYEGKVDVVANVGKVNSLAFQVRF